MEKPKSPRANYVIPFPDFWDENTTTSTESGIVFNSDYYGLMELQGQIPQGNDSPGERDTPSDEDTSEG